MDSLRGQHKVHLPVLLDDSETVSPARLNKPDSKPLIVIDKIFCSKDSWVCYKDGKYTEEYLSLGFTLKTDYYLDSKSSEDNLIYHWEKTSMYLFNKILLFEK